MGDETDEAITQTQLALGLALKTLRERTGMSQLELSRRTGAHNSYISQVEAGLRDIRWSTVTRLLAGMGASVSELAATIERQQRS